MFTTFLNYNDFKQVQQIRKDCRIEAKILKFGLQYDWRLRKIKKDFAIDLILTSAE